MEKIIMKKGYVYLIEDQLSIFTKIGETKDLEQRLKAVQSCNPISIDYKKTYEFPCKLTAYRFEKLLQKTFKHKNVRLEWFTGINQKDYIKIDKLYEKTLQRLHNTNN